MDAAGISHIKCDQKANGLTSMAGSGWYVVADGGGSLSTFFFRPFSTSFGK